MIAANQTPEQIVRDKIDTMLQASGWQVQSKKHISLTASRGVADRKCRAEISPTDYILFVNKNFQDWIFMKQAGTLKYTEEQVQWLRMIKDYIANSFRVDREHFELDAFNKQGGLGKMWQLFGEETDGIINELNEVWLHSK